MTIKPIAITTVAVLLGQALVSAAQQKDAKPNEESIRLRAEEVLVDAIVTDRKNKTIGNLTADDFEILEDGVKQKIVSFRYESRAREIQTGSSAEAASRAPDIKSANMVSIVLDAQTTRDGALRARKAALDYIATGMRPNDYVAVFGMDLGLMVLCPYTNDKAAIRQAVEVFTSRESKKYLAVANEVKAKLESLVEPLSDADKLNLAEEIHEFEPTPPAPTLDARSTDTGIDARQVMLTIIALTGLRVLRVYDRYEREFQGWRSVNELLAIINAQKNVKAGRKTLILFSEGFGISPAVKQQFLSIISAANTAGVTIYALDIAGLRLSSPNEEAMRERDAAAIGRLRNANPELVSGGVSALGRNEEIAGMNTVTTLDQLSEDTGGYTVKNTNELSDGLRRIMDELGDHYTLTYLPSNQNYNGDFRRIAVRLPNNSDYRVRARRGYYALRTLDDVPLLSHEVPLLERANSPSPVQDFPIYAGAYHFRGTTSARLVALYCSFPVKALEFKVDDKTKTFSARFAVLALVRNSANEIVRKVGQEFTLKGPVSQLEDTKSKPQLYSRLVLLPPGEYKMEAVARDSVTGKASVTRSRIAIPEAAPDSLNLSSVIISRGVNPLTAEQKTHSHPLYLEGQAYFVPNIEQSFSQARDKNILVHFNAYVPKGSSPALKVDAAFLKGGQVFTQASGPLPAADSSGRVQYSTSFGTDNFPPGEYDLRITVSDGSKRVASVAHFAIQP